MAKLFPIQNVSFRGERDNFLTEGGGSKTLPKWVDEATIVANGRRVHGQLGLLSELFADEDRTMPVIAEVTLNKKATAKSYRSAVRGMLDVGSKRNVIGVTSVGKLLVKIDSGDDLNKIEKGTDIVSLDFPYPQCLVENGEFIGNIKLTLAVNPVVNATQGCEYCQSQADVLLETYDHVEYVQLGEGTMMRNEARTSNDAVNVLNGAFYSAKAFNKEFAEERMLIEQGDKYQPIKKYVVDLSKMTPANKRKALGSSRKWALKINGLYRDAAEQSLLRDGEVLAQDVVVVVTISDPRHQGQVYAECLRLLGERGYVHADIHVSHHLEIDNS